MFNALSGMGGGGQVDKTAANNANTALYTTFAVFGILGGGIYNILGPRLTLVTGCSTYVLYAASFLYYNHKHHQAFAIVAGALLGVGAGLLWSRRYHDVLPNCQSERNLYLIVLEYFQHGRSHRWFDSFCFKL